LKDFVGDLHDMPRPDTLDTVLVRDLEDFIELSAMAISPPDMPVRTRTVSRTPRRWYLVLATLLALVLALAVDFAVHGDGVGPTAPFGRDLVWQDGPRVMLLK
jgi:hypothetical protein